MAPTSTEVQQPIGLALSGGGVRAAAFHAGVLQWFAEKNLLKNVEHISSVSGGSLYIGLLFHFSEYRWPTSGEYIERVLPNIRNLLTNNSLQLNAVCRLLFSPLNWRYFLSRANVLAQSIEHFWGVSATLGQLPQRPVWSINGTTAETGRRFRFKGAQIGDYEIGYADAENFKLADAMAVSAAFPAGIGPLRLDAMHYKWCKRASWDSTEPLQEVKPKFKRLHLYDGGVYDNLGLEPLFDVGKQVIKNDGGPPLVNFLVVSDAGSPCPQKAIPGPLHPGRLKRVADVAFEQTRALRVRSFINFLKNNPAAGMYLQIGSKPLDRIKQYAKQADIESLQKSCDWLPAEQIATAVFYHTTLTKMSEKDFDLLARHGYETAQWNHYVFLGP